MITMERKGENLIITVPASDATVAQGHLSTSGKNWVFGASKLQVGDLTVQVSAYTKRIPEAGKAAA